MAATRERLHEMIDALPPEQFDAAAHAIWALSVPEDDEPVTDEDLEASARVARPTLVARPSPMTS